MLIIIVIILLFASLVLLHEWGHFIMARRNGVEVEEFGFGFPPRLYGRMHGKTLYSINLLPLGGFVRLKGEDAADRGPGTFGGAKFSAQTRILLAGVAMNALTAVALLYYLAVTGMPGLGASFEPSFLKPTYAQPKQLIMADVEKGSPADKAGLKRGDYVLSAGGTKIETADQLHDFTVAHAGKTVVFTVREGNTQKQLSVKLRGNSDQGALGVSPQQVYKLRYDPLSALVAALYITGALFVATVVGVVQLIISIPALIIGLFGHSVPQAAQAASGPVGIIYILKSISSLGYAYIFLFMANISVALAAFNILPLPALDGGRWAVLAFQRVFKRRISAESEAKYHAIGFIALIALMLLISVYDIRKFF